MPAPHHHRLPSDLGSFSEPVYLGLDVVRALGLAGATFLTLWAATWRGATARSVFLVGVWGLYLALAFGDADGFPVWRLALWVFPWLGRRLPKRDRSGRGRVFSP